MIDTEYMFRVTQFTNLLSKIKNRNTPTYTYHGRELLILLTQANHDDMCTKYSIKSQKTFTIQFNMIIRLSVSTHMCKAFEAFEMSAILLNIKPTR